MFPFHLLTVLLLMGNAIGSDRLPAAEPELKSVFPAVCQQGESIEIMLDGNGLDRATTLYFSRDGLAAERIEKGRFRVTVLDSAAVGECDLWVATKEGVAGPRRFCVTPHPVVVEQEGNDTPDEAQEMTVPTVIAERLDKAADLDWFAFEGQAEQQVTISCRSASLDGSVQPAFTCFGPDGRLLAHSPPQQQEPQVTFCLPATGTYQILVRDRAYRKDDFSFYQLEVGTGSEDGKSAERSASLIRPDDLFGTIVVQDEQDETTPAAAPIIELPFRISGRFRERNDVDRFRLRAKKDQLVHIEAFGERLGQFMDLEIDIYDFNSKLITTASDLATPKGIPATLPLESLDPAIDWKVPADGEYTLIVRDLYGGSIFGPSRDYQLIVELQQPRFFVTAMPSTAKPSRGAFVKQGGNVELSLIVVRTGGFAGPVTVRAQKSPAGITADPCVLEDKEVTKTITLSAAQDAPTGFTTIRLVAEAEIDSDKHTMPVQNAVNLRSGMTRRIDEMVIYVSE